MKTKKPDKKRLRRYLVPVIYTYTFGAEVEVEATSARQARKLALDNTGDSGGLDWDRALLHDTDIGSWMRVKEITK